MSNLRRSRYLKNSFQTKLMILMFASMLMPTLIVSFCLYYMIFNFMANRIGIPEPIFYYLIPVMDKVNAILLISIPAVFLIFWFIALDVSHRIAGPVYRLEKELDERIKSKSKAPIRIRKNDELQSLVAKVNKVLERLS